LALGNLGQVIDNNIKYFFKNWHCEQPILREKKTAFIENNINIVGMVKVS
jgi:hypothetical protein